MEHCIDDSTALTWYRIAKPLVRWKIPARDVEDVIQEAVLALLRQAKKGPVSEALAKTIVKRVIFSYWDRTHGRHIENRSYRPILFFCRNKAVISGNEVIVFPLDVDAIGSCDVAVFDTNLEAVEDKELLRQLAEFIPVRLAPVLEAWLQRKPLPAKSRQQVSRLIRKLRKLAA